MAGEALQTSTSAGTTPPSASADPFAATSNLPALPSLNPSDSPYQPLALPQVAPPAQHPLPEQDPNQNIGAAGKAGAVAFMVDKVLRGATQGYDQARLQHAQQFNKKMTALSALQQQLGQQYKEAYNDVGSSRPGMTPERILADPKVKQLRDQLRAVHQTTLDSIQKYMPQLGTDGKPGKGGKGKGGQQPNLLQRMFGQEPDEALRAYAEAASKLGPTAFYQVATPQQLQAMHEQRQGKAAEQTAQTTESGSAATKAQNEARRQQLLSQPAPTDPAAAKARQDEIDRLTTALTPLSSHMTADEMKRQDYQSLLNSGQAPKGADGQPLSYEAWAAYAPAQGRAAAAPPKTPMMKSGIWQGHNVNAYYNLKDHVWMNSDGGQPIPGFAPAPTFAETGLYEPVLTYDLASGRLVSGTFNRRTGETRAQAIGTTGPLSSSVASSIQKNIQPAVEADTRYKIMLDNSIDALMGDQQAMVSLLMNHIGMTLGAQKGTRVAKSIIDEAQASAPWTQRVYAAWGHWDASGDWVYDGYKTGTKLTGRQIHQMIGLAKERRVRQWQQAQEGARAVGVDLAAPPLDTSLSTARVGGGTGAGSGQSGQFDVTDPKGKVHHFETKDQADHFKKLAGIK